jgi:feruloyl esterase
MGFDGLMANGFSQPILGLAAFGRRDWDPMSYDFDRDQATVDAKLAPILDAANPDLSAFKARSGKIIMYQGWHDSLLVPQAAPDYFNQVVRKMNGGRLNDATIRQTQKFLRLFMVPGMAHVPGGPGPWPNLDDINALLEDWVERGIAPERFLATKVIGHESGQAVTRTRLICPYPRTAKWNRTGSTDDADSFICANERP